jgi:methyl-accepting chemotaxis protein
MKRRDRWIDVLRKTAQKAPRLTRTPQPSLDEATLWGAHDRAVEAVKQTAETAERVAANAARHRTALDGGLERIRTMSGRLADVATGWGRVQEAFDRLGLVALNAGLEGAKIGDPAGRALVLVADETRAYVQRGGDAAKELAATVAEIGGECTKLQAQLDQERVAAAQIADEAARAQASVQSADRAVEEIGERLRRVTGSDPEVARALHEASSHARGLLTALSTLSSRTQAGPALAALRPVMEPLVRLLGEIDGAVPDEDGEAEG